MFIDLFVSTAPLLGAWIGLIGWLLSKFGTTESRIKGLLLAVIAMFFGLEIISLIWGRPFGDFFTRNLQSLVLLMASAVFFALLFVGGGGAHASLHRRRLLMECTSVGVAALGLAFDWYQRASGPLIDWCKALQSVPVVISH
jgi:hypothetical protein